MSGQDWHAGWNCHRERAALIVTSTYSQAIFEQLMVERQRCLCSSGSVVIWSYTNSHSLSGFFSSFIARVSTILYSIFIASTLAITKPEYGIGTMPNFSQVLLPLNLIHQPLLIVTLFSWRCLHTRTFTRSQFNVRPFLTSVFVISRVSLTERIARSASRCGVETLRADFCWQGVACTGHGGVGGCVSVALDD